MTFPMVTDGTLVPEGDGRMQTVKAGQASYIAADSTCSLDRHQ